MKSNINRRKFLKYLAAGAAGVAVDSFLTACGQRPTDPGKVPPSNIISPTNIPPSATAGQTSSPVQVTRPPLSTPSAVPSFAQMAVTRGGEPEILVQRAIAALGGMEQFVKPGNDVIIKPNICVAYHSYEYAATTNPWVVGALVKLCLAAGAKRVRVMDYPFGGEAAEAYAVSGIAEQVNAAGGSMETMAPFKYVTTTLPNARALKNTDIYDDIMKTDVLINVPIAKTHGMAGLTLGMKNLMGTVRNREIIHHKMGQNLADLAGFLKPTLTVIDAVRILTANGPTGGNLDDVKKMDTVIASRDIMATDTYAASLFGVDPNSLAYITAGREAGIGQGDLSQVKIEEINVGG
jgi:uncharacterized protein (DUF362 family)